jgi:hypothetical protein
MTEPTIICPKCKNEIKLTESLAEPLVEKIRQDFERRLNQKDEDIAKREEILKTETEKINQARVEIDEQVMAKLMAERSRIATEEARKARTVLDAELKEKADALIELQTILRARDEKLAEAQKSQAEFVRKQRELEDAKREMDLTIEKQIQAGLQTVRDKARQEAEESLKLKVAEKEMTISAMQKQIEDLKRRAEQGSQQLQGEVQELEIEALLRARFPLDQIDPVPKGEFGGDTIQRVTGPMGQVCGMILWEFKRTKNWSDGWLAKLRDDARVAKAEIAVLVSSALPKGVEDFELVNDVWVLCPRVILPVATLLRQSLIELAMARQATEGQQGKMEMLYGYLTGPRFRQRVGAIVEAFSNMKEDLDRERKAITKQWAKRDEQIERVMQATVGMYGDMQGIAGKSLQEIEGLDFPALNSTDVGKDSL